MSVFATGLEIAGESVVLFGIGFLLAALLAVLFFPLVHNRAARLTTRRIEASVPTSIKQAQIEKDFLRADFAISTRRFETTIENLREKTCAQGAALAEKSETISRLETELGARSARLHALEERADTFDEREKSLHEQLRATEDEVTRLRDALRAAEMQVAEQRSNRSRIGSVIAEFSRLVGDKRREIVALRNEVDIIRHQAVEIADSVKAVRNRSPYGRIDVDDAGLAAGLNGGANGNGRAVPVPAFE